MAATIDLRFHEARSKWGFGIGDGIQFGLIAALGTGFVVLLQSGKAGLPGDWTAWGAVAAALVLAMACLTR